MTRSFKSLGLILLAPLAICALVALPASAQSSFKFKANTANPILTGVQHGSNVDVMTVDAGTISCNSVTYVGALFGTETTEIEIFPTYKNCTAFGFIGVPIDTNGCGFRFTTGTKTANGNYEGNVHFVCPSKPIEVTAPFECTVTIPGAQTLGGTVTYTNLGSGHTQEITVDLNLSGMRYEEHNVSGFPCAGDTEEMTNGTYQGALLITGENGSKQHIGVFVG